MTTEKKHNIFWPDVSTLEAAKKAVGYGVGAATVVAVLTAGFATWALMSQKTILGFVDAWAYLDAVLFALVAFGIYKEKRFASVAGLLLFVGEKAYQVQVTGQFQGAVMAVFLTVFFVSGVRGTFALQRFRPNTDGQLPADAPRPSGSDGG